MFIKQISVFLENKRGSLRVLTDLLGKNAIDLLAVSIADTKNFGIVRFVVRSEECARHGPAQGGRFLHAREQRYLRGRA